MLAELRADHFSPRAWRVFLAASFARAEEQRRAHRGAHRQTVALAWVGLGAWMIVALAGRPGLAVAGAAWLAVLTLMVDWHLGMLESPEGETLDRLGLANLITIGRGAALPALVVLSPGELAAAVAVLGALDVADGVVARRRHERTRLGTWLDGSLDTLLAVVFAFAAARAGAIPSWLAGLVLVRIAVPWTVIGLVTFLTATPPRSAETIRADGWRARGPGVIAATGLVLALTGHEVGIPIAAVAVVVSLVPFTRAMLHSVPLSLPGE